MYVRVENKSHQIRPFRLSLHLPYRASGLGSLPWPLLTYAFSEMHFPVLG